MRALIVDDDAEMSRLLFRALSMWGWEADECRSIFEALALLRSGRYDLALCDVDLPGGDGIFLARALSKARPFLRVIVASGNPLNVERAQREGFIRCLRKPFDLNDLKALIDPQKQLEPRI